MKSTEIVIHFKSIAVGYLDDQDDYYTYKHYTIFFGELGRVPK